MTGLIVPIVAMAAKSERAAILGASANIAQALSKATGNSWICDCRFIQELELQNLNIANSIVVTSLGSEVDAPDRWEDAEPRLRKFYAGLCESGHPVFICTVLRHTGASASAIAMRRLVRIRRLNLLAAHLSREYGAFVIDIDRKLADVGARRIPTDYTLQGEAAEKLASDVIAMEVVLNGLDGFVSVAIQDRAKVLLDESRSTATLLEIKPSSLMAIGQGRRKQIVNTVVDTNPRSHASWLIDQVMQGRIPLSQAFEKLHRAIRSRGAWQSFAMLASGVARLIGRRT
jgi:hypothetical protein